MKRILLVSSIILISLFLLSCSRLTNFLIINSSSSPIEVEYVITEKMPIEQTWSKPLKMSLADWNKWFGKKEWIEIPPDQYNFDAETGRCKLLLSPNEVLNFNRELESFEDEYKYFNVEYLKLEGSQGEVVFKGKDFYKQLERINNLDYFVDYK